MSERMNCWLVAIGLPLAIAASLFGAYFPDQFAYVLVIVLIVSSLAAMGITAVLVVVVWGYCVCLLIRGTKKQ